MSISMNQTAAHASCSPQPRSIWSKLGAMIAVNRQRRALLMLDDHLLTDIGVSRTQATKEGQQVPWNAPDHWLK